MNVCSYVTLLGGYFMGQQIYTIENLCCANCAAKIEEKKIFFSKKVLTNVFCCAIIQCVEMSLLYILLVCNYGRLRPTVFI